MKFLIQNLRDIKNHYLIKIILIISNIINMNYFIPNNLISGTNKISFIKNKLTVENSQINQVEVTTMKVSTYIRPFLIILFIFIILDLSLSSANKAISNISNNAYFNIIAPSLIDNPIVLMDLSEFYLKKKNIEKASQYLIHAEYKMMNTVNTLEMKKKFNVLKDNIRKK